MTKAQVQFTKQNFPKGTRVKLIEMKDPYAPVPSGTEGTVEMVDDMGTIHMKWDNNRSLGLIPNEDVFVIIN